MVAAVIPPVPKVDFIPMKDYVLIEPIAAGQTPSGIAMPDDADLGLPCGRVIAVGPGRPADLDPSKRYPMDCRAGDIVYVGGSGVPPVELWIDGNRYLQVRDRDVTAWKRKTR